MLKLSRGQRLQSGFKLEALQQMEDCSQRSHGIWYR